MASSTAILYGGQGSYNKNKFKGFQGQKSAIFKIWTFLKFNVSLCKGLTKLIYYPTHPFDHTAYSNYTYTVFKY